MQFLTLFSYPPCSG